MVKNHNKFLAQKENNDYLYIDITQLKLRIPTVLT